MRCKFLLLLLFVFVLQTEFKCYGADQSTSENPLETTTKKSGFFKGIKKFFGGGSKKTTENPTSTISTTTSKPTTTTSRVATKATQKPQSDLPGFPPRQQPQPNKPSLTALSYPATPPPNGSKIVPITTTSTTTTAKPTNKVDQTTTTKKPTIVREDFPALPTKKPALPVPTPTPVGGNAWSTSSTTQSHGSVSFITTPKPQHPIPAVVPPKPTVPNPSSTAATKTGGKSLVTDEELSQISEQIFAKETNSKLSNLHLDLQGQTKSFETKDEAPKPLFNPDNQALSSNSIGKMMQLFNNYEADTTVNEFLTPMERIEENQFVDIIMISGVMRQAMSFLQNKGLVSPDPFKHREMVKTIWFTMYSRGLGKIGSSAFEHVFLNEIKNGTLIGLHNWVYFMEQEKAGKLNYMGYIRKANLGNKAMVLETRFTYDGLMKPVNSLFVGTSPELEIALYTLCFQLRPDEDCPLTLGGQKVNIVTHTWKYRGNKLIGSAYPSI